MNVFEIDLDLSKEPIPAQIVRMGQGDNDGTTIVATVFDNGIAADLSGMSASFEMRLPNGSSYVRDANCEIDDNVITYVVDEGHCCAVHGFTDEAYFSVTDGTSTYSTNRFRVKIERAAHDGSEPAESWDNAVDQLIERGNEQLAAYSLAESARATAETTREQKVITSASGTVDSGVGTPSVDVTLGQPAEGGRNIAFAFHNIKGQQNVQSDWGESDSTKDEYIKNKPSIPSKTSDLQNDSGFLTSASLPTMSPSTKGGAKLQAKGGLALRDGSLGIGSLVQSGNQVTGPIANATAKGWATQDGTPTPSSPQEIKVARGRNLVDESASVWRVGGFDGTTGAESTSTNRMTTTSANAFDVVGGQSYVITTASTHKAQVYFYNGTTFISSAGDNFTTPTHLTVITAPANATKAKILLGRTDNANMSTSDLSNAHVQLTLGSIPQPYVPYGRVGLEVKGRNVYRETKFAVGETWTNGVAIRKLGYNEYTVNGTSDGTKWLIGLATDTSSDLFVTLAAGTYTASLGGNTSNLDIAVRGLVNGDVTVIATGDSPQTFTLSAETKVKVAARTAINKTYNNQRFAIQLELGSTAHAYQPYCDSTTPIPLPEKGWAGALPDGTADTLAIDAAGKWEWESRTNETTQAATDGITGTVGTDVMSTTGQIADGATVLYKLATPTTQSGYINLPSIGGDAVVTIPELDALGVDYWVEQSVQVLARQLVDRIHDECEASFDTLPVSQGGTGKGTHTSNAVLTGNGTNAVNNVSTASGALYATSNGGAASFGTLPVAQGGTGATTAAGARTNLDAAQSDGASGTLKAAEGEIDNLEASIAPVESVTATSNHAIGDYFMLGNVLMCATAAIASGETITTSNATPATVQSQIDTLRDSVSPKSYTPTWADGEEGAHWHCKVVAGICHFMYQGANKTHANDTLLATLPSGCRPKTQTWIPCTGNNVYCVVYIETDGRVIVTSISSTTVSARLHFCASFPV